MKAADDPLAAHKFSLEIRGVRMSPTVLVADDSQTIRKVVKMALKVAPFEVISVGSGEEALRNAGPNLSLIVLDYHFSDMSGYDVAKQFKDNAQTADVPILMLAGEHHGFDEQRARNAGVDRIIPKPFDTDTLLDAIVGTTGTSKKALVKRQRGAPKTESPFSPEESDEPVSPAEPEPAGAGASSGGGAGGRRRNQPGRSRREGEPDSGTSKPRLSTPGGESGSEPASGPGKSRPGSGGSAPPRGASGAQSDQSRPGDSGFGSSGGSNAPGGGPGSSQPSNSSSSGGARLDLNLDSEPESSPEPAPEADRSGGGSSPRFRSPSSSGEPVGEGNSGSTPRRRTPESQSQGAPGEQPGAGAEQDAGFPGSGSGGAGASAPSDGGVEAAGVSQDEIEAMVEDRVKEIVRDQLPDLLRKIMGDVFQERVLPKLLEHGKDQVESVVGDQLDRRIHDEVRRQLDELLEDL